MSILTEVRKQTKGSTGSTVGPSRMLLEQLLEARCALERSEAGRTLQPLLAAPPNHPATARSRDCRRPSDEPAQQKIPRSRARPPRLHGTIVPCGSRHWVTYCSTWSCCSRSRWPRAATCAPRTGRAPGVRRPTSRRGRPSSEPRRGVSRSGATTRRASSWRESSAPTASSSSALWAKATRGSSSRSWTPATARSFPTAVSRRRSRRRSSTPPGSRATSSTSPATRSCGSRSLRLPSWRLASRVSGVRVSRSTSRRGPRSGTTARFSSASSSTSSRPTSSSRPRRSGSCWVART
jgi:hypothetical protein